MKDYPSIKFQDNTCFNSDTSMGFDAIKPINVIIGKNNSGKSRLLNLLEFDFKGTTDADTIVVYSKKFLKKDIEYLLNSLNRIIQLERAKHMDNSRYRYFTMNREERSFLDNMMEGDFIVYWKPLSGKKEISNFQIFSKSGIEKTIPDSFKDLINVCHEFCLNQLEYQYKEDKKFFRRISAERDIFPENDNCNAIEIEEVAASGSGATTILTQIYSLDTYTKDKLEMLVTGELLEAFNKIIADKNNAFTRITTKRYEKTNKWQIQLEQEIKGLVALDNSGSGLKTILLVLINMIVLPAITKESLSKFVFAFEELENNLHPTLFRNLLGYIQKRIKEENSHLFLTTHSSIALDFFSPDKDAQILSVQHNGECAEVKTITSFAEKSNLISELGAKASDILQANGIIWVEGPSDRIYINKWISLFDKDLVEGRDYQCAFYGGALLARHGVEIENQPLEEDKIDLLKINRNAFVICDSDKTSKNAKIKARVESINDAVEVLKEEGFQMGLWVLGCREIENYLTANILEKAEMGKMSEDPKQYECLFPRKSTKDESYLEKALGVKSIDKVALAHEISKVTEKQDLEGRFDWSKKMQDLVDAIKTWNSKE